MTEAFFKEEYTMQNKTIWSHVHNNSYTFKYYRGKATQLNDAKPFLCLLLLCVLNTIA